MIHLPFPRMCPCGVVHRPRRGEPSFEALLRRRPYFGAVTATWTSPAPGGALDFSAGQLVGEAEMDALTSNWYFQFGSTGNSPWTAWTPTFTQGSAISISVNWASYAKIGKVALVQGNFNILSAGTGGNAMTVGALPSSVIPPLRTGSFVMQGGGLFVDASASNQVSHMAAVLPTSTQIAFYVQAQTAQFGINPSFACANGDALSFFVLFEVA